MSEYAGKFSTFRSVLTAFSVLAVLWMPVGGAGQGRGAEDVARVLAGAIDIHVHSDPDNVPRSIDGIDVAKLSRSKGIR